MTFPSYSVSSRLIWALAISVVIHVVLLVQDGFQAPDPRLAQSLTATLKTVPVPANVEPEPVAPRLPRPNGRPRSAIQRPATVVPETEAAPVTAAPEAPLPASDGSKEAAPPASQSPAGINAGTAIAGPSAGGLDADGLRGYRFALSRQARLMKHRYEDRLSEYGRGGTVEIRVQVEAGGGTQVSLAKSSGQTMLDGLALDMMRGAAARTVVPGSLHGRGFFVDLPVTFTLKDE